jgi:hypothetical protein
VLLPCRFVVRHVANLARTASIRRGKGTQPFDLIDLRAQYEHCGNVDWRRAR